MSLERKLVIPVFLGLLASLLVGAAFSYQHVVSKVRTELDASLAVGRRMAQHAVVDGAQRSDPVAFLETIVGEFDGDRHLLAVLRGPDGVILRQSTLRAPGSPAPQTVFDLVSGPRLRSTIDLPGAWRPTAELTLETDAHNEVAEAWGDLQLQLAVMSVAFALILGLTMSTLRRSLAPLQDLAGALGRIGAGAYDTRLDWASYRELDPVKLGFNTMARRLAEMEMQNRLLATRMQCVQEDERAEIARDLHDEVAPFLFAVSADAALIRKLAAGRTIEGVEASAKGILESVGHMQAHLRRVLSRLMPDVLLDLGLPAAVDTLVHFWRARKPEIVFVVDVTEERLAESHANVAFRVVQESLSNAVRHARARRIAVSVKASAHGVDIEVTDDGHGLPAGPAALGLGLLGMRERVRSVGGRFQIGNRVDGSGVAVHAHLAEPVAVAAAE